MDNFKFKENDHTTYFKRMPLNETEVNMLRGLFLIVPELTFMEHTPEELKNSYQDYRTINHILPSTSFAENLDHDYLVNSINYIGNSEIPLKYFAMIYIKEEYRNEYNTRRGDRMDILEQENNAKFQSWSYLIKKAKKKCKIILEYLEKLESENNAYNYKYFIKLDNSFNFCGKLINLASLLVDLNLDLPTKEISIKCTSKIEYFNNEKIKIRSLDSSIRNIKAGTNFYKSSEYGKQLEELKQILHI